MVSEKKTKLQISLTKELDKVLTEIIDGAKAKGESVTKSQLLEIAMWWFIQHSSVTYKPTKEDK